MAFLCTFRDQQIVVEDINGTEALNFNGHYLIEVDGMLKPTGRAINGCGAVLNFSDDELIIEEVK